MAKHIGDTPPKAAKRAAAQRHLRYGLSIPERALRSAAGVVGGALRESAAVLVPKAVRDASTYQAFIGQMLDFMAEDVGRVERSAAKAGSAAARPDDYVARKTVGNFIDISSLATLHLSPMLLLAVTSDLAYGSKAYLRELAADLERRGVIDDADRIERADDLLDSVAQASGKMATAFDTPPLSVDGLRDTIEQTREALREIDPAKAVPEIELQRLWDAMQATARREGVDPLAVSGAMALHSLDRLGGSLGKLGSGALSSVRAAATLVDRHVVDHYRGVLIDIDANGFYVILATISRPYAQAVWRNFARDQSTMTERLLTSGALGRAWSKVRRK